MKKEKNIITLAAFTGMTAVILGALGAHTLESKISESSIESFETAVQYQIWHTLAILVLVALGDKLPKKIDIALIWFVGIVLFCGSIYLLSTIEITHLKTHWLGPITPIGGLFFIAGWMLLIVRALGTNK